jgi:hypothetical protein
VGGRWPYWRWLRRQEGTRCMGWMAAPSLLL